MIPLRCWLPFVVLGLCIFFFPFLNAYRHGGFFSLPLTVPGKCFCDCFSPVSWGPKSVAQGFCSVDIHHSSKAGAHTTCLPGGWPCTSLLSFSITEQLVSLSTPQWIARICSPSDIAGGHEQFPHWEWACGGVLTPGLDLKFQTCGQKVPTYSCKISTSEVTYNVMTAVNIAVWYIWKLVRD